MHAMPVMIVVLCVLAIGYRYYSAFLAAKVAVLDETRRTPAYEFNDGQNYHPTNKWVLFGHHFAAISGAGPLIGPVLAIQFGYLPGLIWIVVGVVLAGAAQDMLVLAASVRRGGRSLAEIARSEIGPVAGATASITILFVVIIALAGLGMVVVKVLGGEEIHLAEGTVFELPPDANIERKLDMQQHVESLVIPGGTKMTYPNGASFTRSETFDIQKHVAEGERAFTFEGMRVTLPDGVKQSVPGSSWGTFTIACTIPIALFVGLYMYKIRKGHVVEASLIGAVATLGATVAGAWIPHSPLEPYFSLTRETTIAAICLYGFTASVLPVWMLLCPRDYLSSFLKIGTVILLIGAVIVANPELKAPMVNQQFGTSGGAGPYFPASIFPFCFICIMCGAISGFHALVSSGTTPKMVTNEKDVRLIGYGSMLIEGIVGIVALVAAASLPPGDYWAINIDQKRLADFAPQLKEMGADTDNLSEIEEKVGGESLRGRTGGAVTLAVGMSNIFTQATARVTNAVDLTSVIKYWYHFAIMFEALFILTTIDTGTRIARFLLQEALGRIYPKFDQTDWLPGAILSTGLVTAGWAALIYTGSIDTIWPMFGIANQLLAVIALAVVTTVMVNAGRGRYAWATILPMLFVITTTLTAGVTLTIKFFGLLTADKSSLAQRISGGLSLFFTVFMLVTVGLILFAAVGKWLEKLPKVNVPAEN